MEKFIKCFGCKKEFNYQKEFGINLCIDNNRFDYYCFSCRKNGTEANQKRECLNVGIYPKQ